MARDIGVGWDIVVAKTGKVSRFNFTWYITISQVKKDRDQFNNNELWVAVWSLMVKHHGLIIKGVAVWNHTFKQVPIPLEPINIIGVAVWCLFLRYPFGIIRNFWIGGPISNSQAPYANRFTGSTGVPAWQEANYHIQKECGDCCALPWVIFIKEYKVDHFSYSYTGSNNFIKVSCCVLPLPHSLTGGAAESIFSGQLTSLFTS